MISKPQRYNDPIIAAVGCLVLLVGVFVAVGLGLWLLL